MGIIKEVPKDKKIAIIKAIRGLLGCGLKEAKGFADEPGWSCGRDGVSRAGGAPVCISGHSQWLKRGFSRVHGQLKARLTRSSKAKMQSICCLADVTPVIFC